MVHNPRTLLFGIYSAPHHDQILGPCCQVPTGSRLGALRMARTDEDPGTLAARRPRE